MADSCQLAVGAATVSCSPSSTLEIADYRWRRSPTAASSCSISSRTATGSSALMPFSGSQAGDLHDIPATGRRVRVTEIVIFRVADGRIAEAWEVHDECGVRRQLGVMPASVWPAPSLDDTLNRLDDAPHPTTPTRPERDPLLEGSDQGPDWPKTSPPVLFAFGMRDSADQLVCLMSCPLTMAGCRSSRWRTRAARLIRSSCRVAGIDIDVVRRPRRHSVRLGRTASPRRDTCSPRGRHRTVGTRNDVMPPGSRPAVSAPSDGPRVTGAGGRLVTPSAPRPRVRGSCGRAPRWK